MQPSWRWSWCLAAATVAIVGGGRQVVADGPKPVPRDEGLRPATCPAGQKRCGGSCVPTDPPHGCGQPSCAPCGSDPTWHAGKPTCSPAGATTVCDYLACDDGWIDADGVRWNGCEAQLVTGIDVRPTEPYNVTRIQDLDGRDAIYEVRGDGYRTPGHVREVDVTLTGRTQTHATSVTLVVALDREEPFRRCFDHPFKELSIAAPTGAAYRFTGRIRGVPVNDAIRVSSAVVTCQRTFTPPAPPR